jgi:predicted acetyltransferase
MVNIEIVPAKEAEISALKQLAELYEYDLSEFTKDDVNQNGVYNFPYIQNLAQYWSENTKHPFFIRVDDMLAGFILVSMDCKYTQNAYVIDEFFVMRKYRGLNVGKFATKFIFDLFKGEWELRILRENKPAILFWDKVINEYTSGKYTFHSTPAPGWDGVGYTLFTTK